MKKLRHKRLYDLPSDTTSKSQSWDLNSRRQALNHAVWQPVKHLGLVPACLNWFTCLSLVSSLQRWALPTAGTQSVYYHHHFTCYPSSPTSLSVFSKIQIFPCHLPVKASLTLHQPRITFHVQSTSGAGPYPPP